VAQECRGLIEDPQDGKHSWAHEVPPDARTLIERAMAEYERMFPKPWWRKALDHLVAGDDDDLPRPNGVNNLLWLAFLESGLRVFKLTLALNFRQHFSPFWLLTALLFLALGIFRGWRWSWWTMLIAYPLAVGADVLMSQSNGFSLIDGRLILVVLAVAYLLSGKVRGYFGV